MIGKITGIVDYKAGDHVLIEAAGIGYIVHCAPATLGALPGPGERAALYTELVVREDLMQLFGFRTLAEREWHRLLVSVQGVGAKMSLAILGTLGMQGLTRALATGEAGALRQAPGVGPKLATRIVTELKGKAPAMMALGSGSARPATPGPVAVSAPGDAAAAPAAPASPIEDEDGIRASADALSALVNLGYDRVEAAAAVADAAAGTEGGDADEAALIKAALRGLDRNV